MSKFKLWPLAAALALPFAIAAASPAAAAAPSAHVASAAKTLASASEDKTGLVAYPVLFRFTNNEYLLVVRLNRDPLGLPPAEAGGRDYPRTRGTFTIGGATLKFPEEIEKLPIRKPGLTCVAATIHYFATDKFAAVGNPKIGSRVKITYSPIKADRTYAPAITRRVTLRQANGPRGSREAEVQKALSHIGCDYKQVRARSRSAASATISDDFAARRRPVVRQGVAARAHREAADRRTEARNRTLDHARRASYESRSYTIRRVVDGDTVIVNDKTKGDAFSVQLVGLDAPEVATPASPAQCGGPEAAAALAAFAPVGTKVTMKTDTTRNLRDSTGRITAYLAKERRRDLGRNQIILGWSPLRHTSKPIARAAHYTAFQYKAQTRSLGAWDLCGGFPR